MLQQRMQKDNMRGKRSGNQGEGGLGDSNEEDLERGEGSGEEDNDWNGRTGGQVQLQNEDGSTAKAGGKAIPSRRPLGGFNRKRT